MQGKLRDKKVRFFSHTYTITPSKERARSNISTILANMQENTENKGLLRRFDRQDKKEAKKIELKREKH